MTGFISTSFKKMLFKVENNFFTFIGKNRFFIHTHTNTSVTVMDMEREIGKQSLNSNWFCGILLHKWPYERYKPDELNSMTEWLAASLVELLWIQNHSIIYSKKLCQFTDDKEKEFVKSHDWLHSDGKAKLDHFRK